MNIEINGFIRHLPEAQAYMAEADYTYYLNGKAAYTGKWLWKQEYQFWPPTTLGELGVNRSGYYSWGYDNDDRNISFAHPTTYIEWNPEDGLLYEVHVSYYIEKNSYIGDWYTARVGESAIEGLLESLGFADFDNGCVEIDDYAYFTQTAFNTDEKFEYIRYIWDSSKDAITGEYDRDGDGVIDEKIISHGCIVGFAIVQDDGTIVQEIRVPDAISFSDFYLVRIGGKSYLAAEVDFADREYKLIFYSIDPKANSVKQVNTDFGTIRVRPAIADRNGQVTVELEDDAQEIQVMNAAGQTIRRIPVGEGQRQVRFNARGLGSGVNIIRAKSRNAETSRKFIVK